MLTDEHKNDIRIGKEEWISWVNIKPEDEVFDMDPLLELTMPFWKTMETECVTECCGIDALALWKEDIRKASEKFDAFKLKNDLVVLKTEVINRPEKTVVSFGLNQLFEKSVFIRLINHIAECL